MKLEGINVKFISNLPPLQHVLLQQWRLTRWQSLRNPKVHHRHHKSSEFHSKPFQSRSHLYFPKIHFNIILPPLNLLTVPLNVS